MRISYRNITLKSDKLTSDFRLFIVLFTYILLGVVLFRYYQFQINPDGIGYMGIAHSYLSGNFYGSINDYWSPFFSWLLMPFLYFAQTPLGNLQSAKILTLILGFISIIGVRQLSYKFEMDEIIRTVILFITVPVVLYFALSAITPDLLMVCVLVYYLAIIFDVNYPNQLLNSIFCGILGAFAYLTKSYGFTFFIATFIIFNILHYFRNSDIFRRKRVIKNLVLGFVIFLMISGVWIGLISFKDKNFTIGTAGEINHALVGPQSQGFPQYFQGIHNPNQISTKLIPKDWGPFRSWKNFNYQLSVIWSNSLKVGSILYYFSFLSLLIILAYIIRCIQTPRKLIVQNELLYPLITILIGIGGYIVITVEERYLWIIYILLMLMGGYLINLMYNSEYFPKKRFSRTMKTIVLIIFAFSFIIMPVSYLVQNINTGENFYSLSQTLTNDYGINGNVASNTELMNMGYLAYYMNITYYGQAKPNINGSTLINQLKSYGIDYYFVWGNTGNNTLLYQYPEIIHGNIPNLKVYATKNVK